MCMCSSMYSSVDLSLYTQSACFILSHETLAGGETQFWEVQMKKTEEKGRRSRHRIEEGGLELQGWDF